MSKIADFFKNNYKDIFKPICVLLSICIIIPLALAFTNKVTVNKIKNIEKKNSEQAMQRLIEADEYVEKSIKSEENKTIEYIEAKKGSKLCGYIFTVNTQGYGGDVSVMTAIKSDGIVKAVEILDVSNETPGLGQNTAKKEFYSQFSDKSKDIKLVKGTADTTDNAVNAVTGATISSTAVTKCVNESLDYYEIISCLKSTIEVGTEDEK